MNARYGLIPRKLRLPNCSSFIVTNLSIKLRMCLPHDRHVYKSHCTQLTFLIQTTAMTFQRLPFRFTDNCSRNIGTWRIRGQLDVTSYYVLFQYFYAQHVSDINTSIISRLRLFYWITTLVVCSCLFHFYAQHVSDINTSIISSLRLFYWITTLVVCSCLFHFYAQHVSDINTSIIRSLRLFYWITTLVVLSCLFHFFYAQHVSDINTSIIRSLRLFYWITTLVCVLVSMCVGVSVWLGWGGICVAGWSFSLLQTPDDGCINVRNMLGIEEVK